MVKEKDIEASVVQLKETEQNLQSFAMQKQNMQIQLSEVENSLKELEHCKEKAYKIVGPIMIEEGKDAVIKDLNERRELLTFRIESLEKKEKTLKEKFDNLQKEVMDALKGK